LNHAAIVSRSWGEEPRLVTMIVSLAFAGFSSARASVGEEVEAGAAVRHAMPLSRRGIDIV